jgi:hypothetical protein
MSTLVTGGRRTIWLIMAMTIRKATLEFTEKAAKKSRPLLPRIYANMSVSPGAESAACALRKKS